MPRDGAGRVATGRQLLCGALAEAGVHRGAEATQAGVNAHCGWVQTTCFASAGARPTSTARRCRRRLEALCPGFREAGWRPCERAQRERARGWSAA
jgi:hypothetical protein